MLKGMTAILHLSIALQAMLVIVLLGFTPTISCFQIFPRRDMPFTSPEVYLASPQQNEQADVLLSTCMPGMDQDECLLEEEQGRVITISGVTHFLQTLFEPNTLPKNAFFVVCYTSKIKCPLCTRTAFKFEKLASTFRDDRVRFIRVERTSNPNLCRHIPRYPFVEIYNSDRQLVSSFWKGRAYNFVPAIEKELRIHHSMSDEERTAFQKMFEGQMTEASERLATLRILEQSRKFGT